MIKIDYTGGLGNKLFEYCISRILAEKLGYYLESSPIKGFAHTSEKVSGKKYPLSEGFPCEKIDSSIIEFSKVLKNQKQRQITVSFPVQNNYIEYYMPYKEKIKKWLSFNKKKQNPKDIVAHIRRGDFKEMSISQKDKGYTLSFQFYSELLKKIKYRNFYILTDNPRDPFFKQFKSLNAKILSSRKLPKTGWHHSQKEENRKIFEKSGLEDFKKLASFNKIILSPGSTFSWWAAFLSNADEIYFPLPDKGFWSKYRADVNLIVPEKRYKYVTEKLEIKEWQEALKISRKKRKIFILLKKMKADYFLGKAGKILMRKFPRIYLFLKKF